MYVEYHASVTCRWTGLFHWKRHMNNPAVVPIEVVYLGIGQEPQTWRDATFPDPSGPRRDKPEPGTGQDAVGSDDVTAAPRVTQAMLTVGVDPTDPCRLALSGVITTDRPMTVEYRVVDHLGAESPVRSVEVDHTHTAYVLHHVELPGTAQPDPSGSITASPGRARGRRRHHRSTDRSGAGVLPAARHRSARALVGRSQLQRRAVP